MRRPSGHSPIASTPRMATPSLSASATESPSCAMAAPSGQVKCRRPPAFRCFSFRTHSPHRGRRVVEARDPALRIGGGDRFYSARGNGNTSRSLPCWSPTASVQTGAARSWMYRRFDFPMRQAVGSVNETLEFEVGSGEAKLLKKREPRLQAPSQSRLPVLWLARPP